jgi:hypothetical protein
MPLHQILSANVSRKHSHSATGIVDVQVDIKLTRVRGPLRSLSPQGLSNPVSDSSLS